MTMNKNYIISYVCKIILYVLIFTIYNANPSHQTRKLQKIQNYEWAHEMILDANNAYYIRWLFDNAAQTIVFDVCVQTHGWIGLGLSSSGHMAGSDIVIFWIDSSGKVHLQDRYAEDEEMPIIDDSQDWILLAGYENSTHSCVTFKRAYVTCDKESDLPITTDVTKLIWAYGDIDPIGSMAFISKHSHHHRGHRAVHLLANKFDQNNHLSADVQTWDITSKNFLIPNNTDTIYWCKLVSVPIHRKAHIVRIEPIISPASNAPFVHHMVLYRCLHPEPEMMHKYLDHPGSNCLDMANMPPDFIHCQSIYMVWATGGDAFNLPDNVGIPISEDQETQFFLFEIHYDNPELKNSVYDSSGFRLYYTRNLREFDADTATMGSVADYRLIVPSGFDEFTVAGHCSPQCFSDKMQRSGINIIAALPHGHLSMKKLRVRHFRRTEELPYLVEENNYDFNFQDFRRFHDRRIIMPGDQITVECSYRTNHHKKPIFGGLSTKEEMCMVFLIYYPRMKGVRTCLSGLTPKTVAHISGVRQIEKYDDNDMDPTIVEPREFHNWRLSTYVLEKEDWNMTRFNRSRLDHLLRWDKQKAQCFWRKIEGVDGMEEIEQLISYPTIRKPYIKANITCQKLSNPNYLQTFYQADLGLNSNSANILITLSITLVFALIINI